MIKGLLLIALLAGYTLGAENNWDKCGCCPKWCDCHCVEEKATSLEIALVQDSSGTISPPNWILTKDFLIDVLSGIKCPGNKVAHISFSTNVSLNWNLDSATGMSFAQTVAALQGLPQFQGALTNTVAALETVLSDVFNGGDDPATPNLVIVLTDGMANFNVNMLPAVAGQVHQIAKTLAIGITDQISQQELAIIASGPGDDNVFYADTMGELPSLVPAVVQAILDMFPCRSESEDCTCCCPPPKAYPEPHYYGGCGCHH